MPSEEHESHEARGNARPREMAVTHRIRLTGVLRSSHVALAFGMFNRSGDMGLAPHVKLNGASKAL